jgi:hypothetical protein
MNNAIASSTGENKTRPATAPATSTARLTQTPWPSVGHTVLQGRDEGHGPSPRAISVHTKPAEPRGDRDERVKVLMGALSPWSFRPVSRLPGPCTTPQRKAAAFSREGAGAVWPSTGCGHCDCRGGPEPGTPLGGLGCPPQGGRHMNHATDWLGTAAVRSDPLYPAKRAKPGRGAREVEKFSESSLNATASPERIVPRWNKKCPFIFCTYRIAECPNIEPVVLRFINDCPRMIVDGKSVTDVRFMFAAYVNEQHPFVEKVVGQWTDGASKPKLLPDLLFEIRDGVFD